MYATIAEAHIPSMLPLAICQRGGHTQRQLGRECARGTGELLAAVKGPKYGKYGCDDHRTTISIEAVIARATLTDSSCSASAA